jgi:hypothetical protein
VTDKTAGATVYCAVDAPGKCGAAQAEFVLIFDDDLKS